MHCSQKKFYFLSVFNGSTSILLITLPILLDVFEQPQIPLRNIFETYQRRHRIDTLFEICLKRLKDVT